MEPEVYSQEHAAIQAAAAEQDQTTQDLGDTQVTEGLELNGTQASDEALQS
jgi:hypothetical protein